MRIGSNMPDLQIVSPAREGVSSAAASKAPQASPQESDRGPEDRLSISSLATQALETPEIRQDKVDSLQPIVLSGEYRLDPEQIAGAMFDEF
ncbi:MAG TPA: flagellar biosynthesis anti-sigma factor FlgM [Terriglobales bacterium]|nr:flagellar biosynthesis anti-sigma factor FlgM [Terriglobales bacterium]